MNVTIDSNNIRAVILCGGSGRRMGHRDKGLLPLAGRPFIDYVIERITPQVKAVAINTAHHDDYRHYALPLLHDSPAGGLGPLAGLLAALRHTPSEWLLVVPCDTPQLPHDLVCRMVEAVTTSGKRLCSVSDGERLHGVILLAHRELADSLASYLEQGERRVQEWLMKNDPAIADFSDQPEAFINLNTPEQLAQLEERLCR